jgi:hypothetical protein
LLSISGIDHKPIDENESHRRLNGSNEKWGIWKDNI